LHGLSRTPLLNDGRFESERRTRLSHTHYQFGSLSKFIEENWNLGSLGATDRTSHSIGDMLIQ
jgi:hypothetical protein